MNIYDIAKKTGLSIATVSRVLNNKDNVAEKTKKKVAEVIAETNYIPNAMARGLSTNISKTVAVLVPDAESHFSVAIATLEEELEKYGYDVILYCTGKAESDKEKYLSRALYKKTDAIILVGSLFERTALITENSSMLPPIVSVNGSRDEMCYSILCNEKQAVCDAVKRAYAENRRHILYLYDVETYGGERKIEGFKKAADELGPESVCEIMKTEKRFEGTIDGLTEKLTADKIDAVVCSDDILASRVLNSLHVSKIATDTVAVIGFNNTEVCGLTYPELTSIDNRLRDMCVYAVKLLAKIFAGEECERYTVYDAKLIRRKSF